MAIINEVYVFGEDGSVAAGDVMSNGGYLADPQRLVGHQLGIARRNLENTALRNVSRLCRGVAQFIAENYEPGVVDDGDADKIVEGMAAAISAVAPSPPDASETDKGIIALATSAEAVALTDDSLAITPAKLGAVLAAKARKRLTANLTLYVATTGNDSNNGLSAGSPFATIQKAVNVIKSEYDLNGYVATIQLADGTYTAMTTVNGPLVGASNDSSLTIQGNAATPGNVVIAVTGAHCFNSNWNAVFLIKDMTLKTLTSGVCINVTNGANVYFSNVIFDDAAWYHLSANGGSVQAAGPYSIIGDAQYHVFLDQQARAYLSGVTITLTGTPAFSGAFAGLSDLSMAYITGATFSGAATGTRYSINQNSVINTGGAGVSHLPGSVAGTTATGGQYV